MATTQGNTKPTSAKTTTDTKKGNGKTPAKPISLYPMSEEEALKRLLRVLPPEKGKKDYD
jgi:hypothetical protein